MGRCKQRQRLLWLNMQRSSLRVIGHPLGPGSETKWNATDTYKSCGQCDKVAEFMMLNFRESGHPIILATGALQQGTLKSKRGGRLSIHFCGDYDTVEVIFCTIVSAIQLSIYGAVKDLCEECIPPPASTWRRNQSHWFQLPNC